MSAPALPAALVARLHSEHVDAAENVANARAEAALQLHDGTARIRAASGLLAAQETGLYAEELLREAQRELRRHPAPTGLVHDWGGPHRFLVTATFARVILDGRDRTAAVGDVCLVSEPVTARWLSLDVARVV